MKTEPNTEPTSDGEEANEIQPSEHTEKERFEPHTGHGASPGKIFIGGLAKETTLDQFQKHFEKYGELTDSVIMKDRKTLQPRGFGFVTYADPSVVDTVIQEPHIINGKQVEIKRTIPKGAIGSKDFKTKKIFVGGLPTTVSEEEFKSFFTKYGEVKENMIMRDHTTSRSRGFGFITFETEEAVDNLLSKGNKIDFGGTQVEIKKAEPKKSGAPPPLSKRHDTKPAYGGGFGDAYGGYAAAGDFGVGSYRSGAGMGGRSGAYGGYGGSEFGGGYGGYGGSAVGGYRGDPTLGYSGRYGGGYGRGYDIGGAGAGAGAGAYGGAGEGYGAYGGGVAGGFGGGYDTGLGGGAGYGSNTGAPFYGNRGAGYGGSSGSGGRYHPYSR